MEICITTVDSIEAFNNECCKAYKEVIDSGVRDLSYPQFIKYFQIDLQRFAIPLEFWFGLNKLKNDEWFLLTDELINLIGYKSSNSNKSNNRTNLIVFIRKQFKEHLDYYTMAPVVPNTGRGGHNKLDIYMKKRPFKKLLATVGTETSSIILDYLLDIEDSVVEYMKYSKACELENIKEHVAQIREAPLIYELDDVIDENKVVKFSNVDDLHRHSNGYLYRTTDMDNLRELAQTMRYPNAMRCNDKMELIRCIMKEL